MCNVCNACNARFTAVNILRKVSIFSGKVAAKAAKAAKRRSGIQAANAAACCLSGARAPVYCLLAADIICRNLKDLLLRLLSLQKECAVREDSALSFLKKRFHK